jgi:uncharacterized protein
VDAGEDRALIGRNIVPPHSQAHEGVKGRGGEIAFALDRRSTMRLSRPAGVLLALALAAPAAAQPAAPRVPTVAVTGTGEVELKPDLARILVTVGTQADSATQAADLNRAATDRVLARLQGLAVKRDDIRTMNVQVFPTPPRTRPDGSEAKVPRFTASHQLRIVTRDIDGVGRLAGEILASGDMTLQGIAFGLEKDGEADDQARREAVKDARHQAEILAEAAGVHLGRLVEIRNGAGPGVRFKDEMAPMAAMRSQELSVVPPATVRTSATVEMVWEMAPAP